MSERDQCHGCGRFDDRLDCDERCPSCRDALMGPRLASTGVRVSVALGAAPLSHFTGRDVIAAAERILRERP